MNKITEATRRVTTLETQSLAAMGITKRGKREFLRTLHEAAPKPQPSAPEYDPVEELNFPTR